MAKLLLALLLVLNVGEIRCQSIFSLMRMPLGVINGITDMTLGAVRGGISMLNSSVSSLMNGALSITDRIRGVLEEIRRYMITGVPELGLPILDPLTISRIDINISHEALALHGYVEDVTVKYLSKFRLDYINYRLPQNILDLNITFPQLDIEGYYDIKGDVGQLFSIFGKGRFWVRLYDFELGTSTRLRFDERTYPSVYVQAMKVTPKLKRLDNYFEGLMNNEEQGDTFNKAITKLAPAALDTLWPEIEPEVTKLLIAIINGKLQDLHIANFLGTIFDIFKINLNQGRLNVHN